MGSGRYFPRNQAEKSTRPHSLSSTTSWTGLPAVDEDGRLGRVGGLDPCRPAVGPLRRRLVCEDDGNLERDADVIANPAGDHGSDANADHPALGRWRDERSL